MSIQLCVFQSTEFTQVTEFLESDYSFRLFVSLEYYTTLLNDITSIYVSLHLRIFFVVI